MQFSASHYIRKLPLDSGFLTVAFSFNYLSNQVILIFA